MPILYVRDENGEFIPVPALVGPKPVKGEDYWTEGDKAEVVDDVLAALPSWEGGSY